MFRVAGKANADIELTAIDVSRGTVRASASALLATLDATSGHGVKGRARRVELKSEIWLTKRKLSRAWLQVAVPSLSFRSGNTTYAADANLFADTKDLDLANKRGSAIALVLVRNFSASNAVDPVKCQWLGVERATLRTTLAFTPEGETRVEVAGGLDAARGRWGDFEVTGSANLDARYLERATDLVTLDVGGRQLRMKSGTGKREGWEAEVQELHVVSTLERERWRLSGPVRIRAKQFEGRIGRTPVHADLAGDLRLDVLDLEHGEAIASGELFIDHGKLDAGAVHVKEWWGRVNIPTARLNVQENLNLFGSFSAKFRDGVPALGIFAASGDLPGWVPVLLPLHELESSGRFQRTCRTTDIFFEQASGGPLAAAGRIQSVPSDTRGAFLLQLQSLFTPSVGLVTYGDKVGVAVLVGNDWLSEQSKTLDGWAMGQSCKPAPDSCKPEPP